MTNKQVNTETGEITVAQPIIQETENHIITQLDNGKFKKTMKYQKFYSHVPTNQDEMKELFNVFNTEESELVTPLRNLEGKEFEIHKIYTNPYESFNEETGENDNGVTTTFYDGEGYIATSSKSVYYTVMNMMDVFGSPSDENYQPIKVKVYGVKKENGVQLNLKLV